MPSSGVHLAAGTEAVHALSAAEVAIQDVVTGKGMTAHERAQDAVLLSTVILAACTVVVLVVRLALQLRIVTLVDEDTSQDQAGDPQFVRIGDDESGAILGRASADECVAIGDLKYASMYQGDRLASGWSTSGSCGGGATMDLPPVRV